MSDKKKCPFHLQLINAGKGEALRIRAILRSLVPTIDLVGIISIPLSMPVVHRGKNLFRDSRDEIKELVSSYFSNNSVSQLY